jgi:hypothetical protein
VSAAHRGCRGYQWRCVLCEESTEAEETVEHRAGSTTQQNQVASLQLQKLMLDLL